MRLSIFSKQNKKYLPNDFVRIYVIGESVSNIESHNSLLLKAPGLNYESEKNNFTFSELEKSFYNSNNLLIFRDFEAANKCLNELILAAGSTRLKRNKYRRLENPYSNKIAIPLFEVQAPLNLVTKIFENTKEEKANTTYKQFEANPICVIIKNKVLYNDKSEQKYYDIYNNEFQKEFKIELDKEQEVSDYKVPTHSPETIERTSHRIKPAPIIAKSLEKYLSIYNDSGLFGKRHHANKIDELKKYFKDEKNINLKPMDCVNKLKEELLLPTINPKGEYSKILRTLMMGLNLSYRNQGNSLEWVVELNHQLESSSLGIPGVKQVVLSYLDVQHLSWKDSAITRSNDENGSQSNLEI